MEKQMKELKWQAISRSSTPKSLRDLATNYKRLGYKTHITPNGKVHEILWIRR